MSEYLTKFSPCHQEPQGCIHEDDNSCADGCEVLAAIKAAVIAERERCAQLIESCEIKLIEYPSEEAAEFYTGGALDAFIAAAAAIRSSPDPGKGGET